MKPIKIEPSDIRVTIEFKASELTLVNEYIEKSESIVERVYGKDPNSEKCLDFMHGDFKQAIKDIFKMMGDLDVS